MTETRNGQQKELELPEQNRKEMLLDQLADTLELVAEGDAEISDLESCLGCFEEADLPDVNAKQALTRFREKHHVLMSEDIAFKEPTRQHPTRKYLRRITAVIAAAICFGTMYIAGASDEGITKMVGRWTDETFHFGGIGKENESPITAPEGEYDTIKTALAKCEIPESAYPKWIPERFSQEKISVRQADQRFCAVRARYSNADGEACIVEIMRFYQISDADSYLFEKDDSPPIEYEKGGITHYLIKNPAGDSALWNNGNLVCSITGDLTEEEFKRAIDSIYEGGIDPNIEGSYDSVEDALAACKITQTVFPKWIPERFHLEEIYVRQGGSRFCAVSVDYSCDGSDRIFCIDIKRYYDIANAHSSVFEKDDSPPIEYERNGIIHYLIKNPAGDAAVWINENLLCSIVGDLSEDEFKKVIDSIYKE